MKSIFTNSIRKTSLLMTFVLLSLTGYSQNPIHWTMSTDLCAATDTNKLEFSLYIKFDGTAISPGVSTVELAAYSLGINYNPAIVVNGGIISLSQIVARDPLLASLSSPSLNTATLGHIRLTTSPQTAGSGFVVTTGASYFLGRFRLTNTRAFASNTAATFSPQCPSALGRTNYAATYYLNGSPAKTATSFSVDPPQPAMTCNIGTTCSGLISNPPCPIASISAASYTSCGPANINGSVSLAFDSVIWTTSGTGSFSFPTSSGANTYFPGAGETGATLTFKAYKAGCTTSIAIATYINKPNAGAKTTVSACNSYTWALSGQTYTTSGTYTRVFTGSSNCSTIDSLFLTITTGLAPSIAGNTVFCSGDSTLLNAGVYTSYLWSTGATTQNIYVKTAGTFTVTVTSASGCTGSTSATTTLNPKPTPSVTGSLSFCTGGSTTLNASAGFIGYVWSNGATTQNILVNTAGVFTVTVTNANGCKGSTSVTTIVNPNPTPTITGILSFCTGGSTTLNAGTFSSYLWSTGATTQTIPVSTAGSFTVTVTNASGCTGITSVTTNINTKPTPTITGSLSFCAGGSTTLNAGAGFSSYLWSTGATTQTIAANTAATFTVTVSNANGCTGIAFVTTTINASPTPTITGNLKFCAGSSKPLTASAGFSSYLWSTGATTQSIQVSTASTFTVTVTNANGCSGSVSVTTTLNINPTPMITGSLSFCTGGSTSLNASPGFVSYLWSTGATSQTIIANTAGTFTVSVTNADGCSGSASATTTISNNLTPVITGNLAICAGGSSTLNAGAGYSSYNWSTGSTSQTISVNTAGTFTVTVNNGSGCTGSATATTTITSNPIPIITGTFSFCAGSSTILNAGAGFSSYLWSTGASTQTISISTAGSFTVTVTNASGCSGSAGIATIINPLPSVSFSGLATSYPVSASSVTLTGSPIGGTFSGPGISGNTFSPSVAGIGGPYTITYTFINENNCSNAATQQTSVTGTCTTPATPGTISRSGGGANVCPGDNRTYTIAAVAGATSYTWTPPVGATITSGQGTVSVLVNYNAAFIASDTLRVKANNACGSGLNRILRVVRNTPATPSAITGQTFGLCNLSAIPYSITNVSGMTYNWTFSVATGSIASGQGSNAVTANFGPTYVSGAIRVTATNGCGTSALRSLTVRATPSTPTTMTGATAICVNQFGVPYSISPLTATTNYTWICPTGAKINDGVVTSASTTLVTTATAVTVNYAAIAGLVRVRGNNSCGSGSYLSKTVNFVCRDLTDASNLFSVSCYPQPASGFLNISIKSTEGASSTILLSDITGKKVQQQSIKTKEGENLFTLDLSEMAAGLYLLEVISGDYKSNHKIIIE